MSDSKHTDQARRDFLTNSAKLAAGVTLAPGVMLYGVAHARPADQPASDKVRWGMLVDTNKCTKGCDACVSGCENYNGWGEGSEDEPYRSCQIPADDVPALRKAAVRRRMPHRRFHEAC